MKPTKLIEFDSTFLLSEILPIMKRKNFSEMNKYEKKTYQYILELRDIHKDINLTIERINKHIKVANRQLELFNKMSEGVITEAEKIEYDDSFSYDQQGYINLDIRILFLIINVFMDKTPKLLNNIFKSRKKPEARNFNRYKITIKKFKGKEIDKLKLIIGSTIWYDGVKDIRDDYVIHHPAFHGGTVRGSNYLSTTISTSKTKGIKYLSVSNEDIQATILIFHNFIKDIYNFIEENIENIPFDMEKIL